MKKEELFFRGHCEYSNLTELLYLNEIHDKDEKKRAQLHLQQCGECKQLYSEMEMQYKFIQREVQKPVTNKTLDFVKSVSGSDTKYGLVVCERIEANDTSSSAEYKSKVLFTANGSGTSTNKLCDYTLESLPKDSIAIRAMTDKRQKKLLLYLWSPQNEDFEGWEIKISGDTRKATFSQSGMSQIPLMEIEDLNGKVIYFKDRQNAFASGNRYLDKQSPVETL